MPTYIMPTVDTVYIYNKRNTSGFLIIDKYIILNYYRVDTNDVKLHALQSKFWRFNVFRLSITNIFNRILNVDL